MTLIGGVAGEDQKYIGSWPSRQVGRAAPRICGSLPALFAALEVERNSPTVEGSGRIESVPLRVSGGAGLGDPSPSRMPPPLPGAWPPRRLSRRSVDRILDACEFGNVRGRRFARLARPVGLLDTSRVDFETTLEHVSTKRATIRAFPRCMPLEEP